MSITFANRAAAGRELAARLQAYAGRQDVLVLALPRGGVPVGYEVARALGAELDVLVVRKLGVPGQPELAMGAIASGGARWLNQDVIRHARVSEAGLRRVEDEERSELQRREKLYRGAQAAPEIRERKVIVVDDGMATGASMRAGAMALRSLHPARIVVAVPVAPANAAERLAEVVDEFVCVHSPANFYAVGQFYENFEQTTDDEVRTLLNQARKLPA